MSVRFKSCLVPKCKNNSLNSVKIFIHAPSNKNSCAEWFNICGRKIPKNTTGYYCCEDHFNMHEDCENWSAYKLFRSKIKMKKCTVPHKNLTECRVPKDYSQLSNSEKKRKMENIAEYEAKRNKIYFNSSNLSNKNMFTTSYERKSSNSVFAVSVQKITDKKIQVCPVVTTKAVQTEPVQFVKDDIAKTVELNVTSPSKTHSSSFRNGSTSNFTESVTIFISQVSICSERDRLSTVD
ncbi:uncharacterized protein LOC108915988 [Anoplophora glabripennis]|uniref:uncharacterized protein LOC108915988 n=1 Tax=Anoplophora glabripennis TaxID=217634 RepID=UPI000874216B|nr:uncharacterized protein LOC108915988 [Anoplophora glabripennis]